MYWDSVISRTEVGYVEKPQVCCYDKSLASRDEAAWWFCTHAVLVRCTVKTEAGSLFRNYKEYEISLWWEIYWGIRLPKLSKQCVVWQSYCKNEIVQFFDSHEKNRFSLVYFSVPLNYYRIIFGNANVSRIVSIISRNDNILVGKFYSEAWSGWTIPHFARTCLLSPNYDLRLIVQSCNKWCRYGKPNRNWNRSVLLPQSVIVTLMF